MRISIPFTFKKSLYASAVITNPLGTFILAEVISPRLAPLPPATNTSSFFISLKSRIIAITFIYTIKFLYI